MEGQQEPAPVVSPEEVELDRLRRNLAMMPDQRAKRHEKLLAELQNLRNAKRIAKD